MGTGLRPANNQALCLSPKENSGAAGQDQEAFVNGQNTVKSRCISFESKPDAKTMGYWEFQVKDFKKSYAMGKCEPTSDGGRLKMLFRYNAQHCGKAPLGDSCGKFQLQLAPSGNGLESAVQSGAADDNCFAFRAGPTPSTTSASPTPPAPPTPTTPPPSTCDFCQQGNLSCCGDGGIHTFCYDEKFDQCCDSAIPSGIDDPVKVVCALDQGCHPGCTPYSESSNFGSHEQKSLQESRGPFCPGKSGAFALCTGGTSCCGRGTYTPECYPAEYTECCHPEGSEYSVICAKGQGCGQTNGVPYCIDSFEACRKCAPRFKEGLRTYLCYQQETDTCYWSPDPESCREAYGETSTWCPGVFGDLVFDASNESNLALI